MRCELSGVDEYRNDGEIILLKGSFHYNNEQLLVRVFDKVGSGDVGIDSLLPGRECYTPVRQLEGRPERRDKRIVHQVSHLGRDDHRVKHP